MEKPKTGKFDLRRIKEQIADIKENTAEKLKQNADAASEMAEKALKQGTELTSAAVEKIKQGAEFVEDTAENAQDAFNNWRHHPIFEEQLAEGDYAWLNEMVNIKEKDDRNQIDGFDKAIAFDEHCPDKEIVTILKSYADKMDVEFFPSLVEGVYYVDPFNRNRYIQLDQYFTILEQERIEELISVAQDLGAEYIEIAYTKDTRHTNTQTKQGNIGAKMKSSPIDGGVGYEAQAIQSDRQKMGVKKSMNLPGMAPKEPTLKHFKNDIEIKSIIDRRLHKENAIKGDYRCELSFNNSSGIKVSNAASVEGALKKVGIKVKGKMKISDEVMKEDSQRLSVYLRFPETYDADARSKERIEELIRLYETDDELRAEIDEILADNRITLQEFMGFINKHNVEVSLSDFPFIIQQAKEIGLVK